MPSYAELLAQKAALEKQQAELDKALIDTRREMRADVIAQIKSLMAEHGLAMADLGLKVRTPRLTENKMGGTKVPPKYRNHQTGETWSGRGLKPRWLKAALAEGQSIEAFAI